MHNCYRSNFIDDQEIIWGCEEYSEIGLFIFIEEEKKPKTAMCIGVKACPFCGYRPERLNPETPQGCDSPNRATKGSEMSRNDSSPVRE